jgi:predicted RNA-binding protein with PUA-like domain
VSVAKKKTAKKKATPAKKKAPAPMPASTGRWLVKTEPEVYAWADLVREGSTFWNGVRNFQARNNLKAMAVGDQVLWYHSQTTKDVVGVAEVARAHYPDPTSDDPAWVVVDLKPVGALARPVELARIKADPDLSGIALVRQSRLSVMPIERAHFDAIVALGGGVVGPR